MTTKKTSSLLLVAALVASTISIQAIEMPTKATLVTAAVAATVGALYMRKPEKNFTPRYSIQKTRNVTRAFSKDYVQNLWYLFVDGFIGQRKQSSAVKANKDDGKLYIAEEAPAYGVLGTLDSYVTPTVDAAKTYLFGFAMYRFATSNDFKFENFARLFATKGASEASKQN